MDVAFTTQNDLLLGNLVSFYRKKENLDRMLKIITGESRISLRIVDWFATNFAKKHYTVFTVPATGKRFKVYVDYKLKLKAYSKRRFDPFCRWERISIPYESDKCIETTLGQLNFFKWALENGVIDYIEDNYATIESDMNVRNSSSKKRDSLSTTSTASSSVSSSSEGSGGGGGETNTKTRKKREELSVSAIKSIKKETVDIVVQFR